MPSLPTRSWPPESVVVVIPISKVTTPSQISFFICASAIKAASLRGSAITFWHHLRHAKSYAALHLALDAQWIHGKAGINRDHRTMNLRPLVFNRYFHGARYSRPKAFVTCDPNGSIASSAVSP